MKEPHVKWGWDYDYDTGKTCYKESKISCPSLSWVEKQKSIQFCVTSSENMPGVVAAICKTLEDVTEVHCNHCARQ